MGASVLSVNVGAAEVNPAKGVGVVTGFHKKPVAVAELRAPGPQRGASGVDGDFIGDVENHGGDRQAVYAFAREELDWWGLRLGRELPAGAFGENLTTVGLDVDGSRVGDRWALGDAVVLEVAGPRMPCATFALRMGIPSWLRQFSEVGRSGAYLSVVTPGAVHPGDGIRVVSRAAHDVTVPETFRAFLGDLDAAQRVLDAGFLPAFHQEWLSERVARRLR